jgi:uncharacterized Zn finger protein (UPF0148 family)
MIPSTSNALPNLQCVFVEVECSVCGGTGKRQTTPDPAEAERAAVVAWLRKESARNQALSKSSRERAWERVAAVFNSRARVLAAAGDAIEAGEHRKEPRAMDVDAALAEVRRRVAGRTYHEGQPPSVDELLAEEVERLRAALREIAEDRFGLGTLGTDYEQMKVWHAHWSRCAERARRALENDRG